MIADFLALDAALLVLPALALAAGVDLYLTLLFIGLAPVLGWWDALPGSLGDLASGGVLAMVAAFYALEFAAERRPASALVWNALHAIIRPVAGALLGLLVLDGQPAAVQAGGAALAGLLTAGAHAGSTGGSLLLWLSGRPGPHPLLVSVLEDVVVVGLVVLTLDLPAVSVGVAAAIVLVGVRVAPSQIRAFGFTVRLALARAWRILGSSRWRDAGELPRRIREAVEDDGLGGGLRGSRGGALDLPGAPRFVRGWIVVRGTTPVFLWGWRRRRIDLGPFEPRDVTREGFYRRVDLEPPDGRTVSLFVGVDGPGVENLRAEFPVVTDA